MEEDVSVEGVGDVDLEEIGRFPPFRFATGGNGELKFPFAALDAAFPADVESKFPFFTLELSVVEASRFFPVGVGEGNEDGDVAACEENTFFLFDEF